MATKEILVKKYVVWLSGLFSIRPIEVKRFQAICDCDVCCHSRILSSLRDRLFGSPIMGSGR